MLAAYVDHLKTILHASALGGAPWLETTLASLLDFFTGPLTGAKTRYYWVDVVASLAIAILAYALRASKREGFGIDGFFRFCFPKRFFTHPSTILDYQLNVTNYFFAGSVNVFWRLNTAFMTAAVLGALTWTFGPPAPMLRWTTPVLVGFTILMALMEDLGDYWLHRACHKFAPLWAFHKLHHSAEILTPLTAARVHPVELALTSPCKAMAMSLVAAPALYIFVGDASLVKIFGVSLGLAIFGALGNQLHHSHIWIFWGPRLGRLLISPAQHQIHHSNAPRHKDRNFGANFAVWDWLFGSLYLPQGYEEITYGLAGSAPQPHKNLVLAYFLPFWEMIPAYPRNRFAGAVRQFVRRMRIPISP